MLDAKLHQQFTFSTFDEGDASHLPHLVAVDQNRVADGQSRHIVVHGEVGVASCKRIEPFEVVHPQHEHDQPRHHQGADFEFWA